MQPTAITRRGFLTTSLAAVAWSGASLPASEDGFEPLFNGKDLSGWQGDPLLWIVEEGMLVGRSPGIGCNDFLATERRFSDFELRFEVHLLKNQGNSGVQFRSERVAGSMEMIGYQADIGPQWWGNLYDESRRKITLAEADPAVLRRVLKPEDWNRYEVRAEGRRITLKLNGAVTVDYEETDVSIPAEGRIAVQIHAGPAMEVRFRNLRIRPIA